MPQPDPCTMERPVADPGLHAAVMAALDTVMDPELDESVAAIVAGPAEDQDGVRSREAMDRVRDRGACAVHQRVDRDAGCDHRILGRAHLGGGQYGLALDPDHEPFASGWTVAGRR